MKIIVIVGMPGSGKTTLINNNYSNFEIMDDFSKIDNNFDKLKKLIQNKKNIVLSCPFLCLEKNRKKLTNIIISENPEYEIEFIYFENNKDKCFFNINKRKQNGDDRKVENLINILHKEYTTDSNCKILEINNS